MSPPPLSTKAVRSLAEAAKEASKARFIDRGDEEEHLPPNHQKPLIFLLFSSTLSPTCPFAVLRFINSAAYVLPTPPALSLSRKQHVKNGIKDRRNKYPSTSNARRTPHNRPFCQGRAVDDIAIASIRSDGIVKSEWEFDGGLKGFETTKVEAIPVEYLELELLKRETAFGLIVVGDKQCLKDLVLHGVGRVGYAEVVEAAGKRGCLLVTFSGPTPTNSSILVFAPAGFKLSSDLRKSQIQYSDRWWYPELASLRQLRSNAVLYDRSLATSIKWHVDHELNPLASSIPLTSFPEHIRSHLVERSQESNIKTTAKGLPNLVGCKTTLLASLAQLVDARKSIALAPSTFFSSSSFVVDERGRPYQLVFISAVLPSGNDVERRVDATMDQLFAGAVKRKVVAWSDEIGKSPGTGTSYERVSAVGGRDFAKDAAFAMSEDLRGFNGDAAAIVSVAYAVHASNQSSSTTTTSSAPTVHILSSFIFKSTYTPSDCSPALLQFAAPLLGSRASTAVRQFPSPDHHLLTMAGFSAKSAERRLAEVDVSSILSTFAPLVEVLQKEEVMSFVETDEVAKRGVMDLLLGFEGEAKMSSAVAELIIHHTATEVISSEDHARIRDKHSLGRMANDQAQGLVASAWDERRNAPRVGSSIQHETTKEDAQWTTGW